jgi:2-polyprenyl-3-methyl-5-hydroxy-6-metoxy-1,4-benzoquinol methylase
VYVEGYFSPEALQLIFSSGLGHQTPGQNVENARYVSAQIVEVVCERLPVPGGRWLDVGFGNGALITTAAEFGFRTVGLDLREAYVQLMQQFGFEAYAVELENYRPGEPFDVISLADVLEHVAFPKPTLRHAWGLLREGGVLFVSMPNADSFIWQALTRKGENPYWGEIEHYHNFGRRRLYALLAECGFEPIRYAVSARYRACMEVVARKGPASA